MFMVTPLIPTDPLKYLTHYPVYINVKFNLGTFSLKYFIGETKGDFNPNVKVGIVKKPNVDTWHMILKINISSFNSNKLY